MPELGKNRNIQLNSYLQLSTVVMYGCESWTAKKAECRRIDAFELWCWRRLLRLKQILKEYEENT